MSKPDRVTVTISVQTEHASDSRTLELEADEPRIGFAKRIVDTIEEMQTPMRITSDRSGLIFFPAHIRRPNRTIPAGTTVVYLGHIHSLTVFRGNVRVRLDDDDDIGEMSLECFPALRSSETS